MPLTLAILEDDARRIDAMRSLLAAKMPVATAHFFVASAAMTTFLGDQWPNISAVSLDHDLELIPDQDGRLMDPGTGREVADFLALRPPAFPIVIHSSNHVAAIGMQAVLQETGWAIERVAPYDDLAWIGEVWWPAMRQAICRGQTPSAIGE